MFQNKLNTYKANGLDIVYLDESGFAHDMPRTHGYALKGQRCYGTQDWGARGRTNVIGALLGERLLTVTLFQDTINTATFEAWLAQDLLPKLKHQAIIVMDNAAFHKSFSTQELIEKAGHVLEFLPPYSPDLNPIEHKWAQAKAIRRTTQCSIDDLFNAPDL